MSYSKREEDLKLLLQFCEQHSISGWCANVWYSGLITRYPFYFLLYSQFSKKDEWRKEKAKDRIKEELIDRVNKLLTLPLEADDPEIYEKLLKRLDEIINERIRKIKN